MVYKDIWLSSGMATDVAELTHCHPRSVLRWLQRNHVPPTAYALIDLVQNGKLEKIHESWAGWRICSRTGQLWTPNGERVDPHQIMAIRYRMAQIAAMKNDLRSFGGHNSRNEPVTSGATNGLERSL